MLADSLLTETRTDPGRAGGRPGTHLALRPSAHVVAAVRFVGPDVVETSVADLGGRVLERRRSSRADFDTSFGLPVLGQVERLAAVALTLPGIVDQDAGTWTAAHDEAATAIDVVGTLEDRLGVPVAVANVAAAALAGAATTDGAPAAHTALVFFGHGVGSAVVSRGRLVSGVGGSASELGHLRTPDDDRPCPCGRRGCLELSTSVGVLRGAFERATSRAAPAHLDDLERAAGKAAPAIVGPAARRLALGASWLADVTGPERLWLAGSGFLRGGDVFEAEFRREFRALRTPHGPAVDVRRAPTDAAEVGGIRFALDRLPVPLRPMRGPYGGETEY